MSGCSCITVPCESDFECLLYRANTYTMQAGWETIKECYECGDEIKPGEVYLCIFGIWRDLDTVMVEEGHFCVVCQELTKHFFCGGFWCHGFLFDDIQMHLEESLNPECCYDGLSPAAAEKLEERVWSAMFLEEDLADEEIENMGWAKPTS